MSVALRDTAGQERYASLAPLYYRGASAACVAYDITNAESFQKAKHWVSELQKNASGAIGERRLWRFCLPVAASARRPVCQGMVSALQPICCWPHGDFKCFRILKNLVRMGGLGCLPKCPCKPASMREEG